MKPIDRVGMASLYPTTDAGLRLLDQLMPAPVADADGRISVVDVARLDARDELAGLILDVENAAVEVYLLSLDEVG